MNQHFCSKMILMSVFLLGLFSSSRSLTPVPGDLHIIGNTGGMDRWAEQQHVQITADGKGLYVRYQPSQALYTPIDEYTFVLTQTQVTEIWQAIEANDFFNLDSTFTDSSSIGGDFVRLYILADGVAHIVYAENTVDERLDSLITVINRATPGEMDLIYEPTIPPRILLKDPCADVMSKFNSQSDMDVLKKIQKSRTGELLKAVQVSENCDEHPGTVVSCKMTLQEAVDSGIATLAAKSAFNGDAVSVTINNQQSKRCKELTVKVYLEFYGPGATLENVEGIMEALQKKWSGLKTSDGRALNIQFEVRVARTAGSPPGTPGYHQINVVEQARSQVFGRGSDFDINQGTGTATWTSPDHQTKDEYAHEAGHFLGLPDRYDEYTKLPNSTWIKKGNAVSVTEEILADDAKQDFPSKSVADVRDMLKRLPIGTKFTVSQGEYDNDLMAAPPEREGKIQQSDIDLIASRQEGILVTALPGQVFVYKGGKQNLVGTHIMEMFVQAGKSKTCGGLYASCMDADKKIPTRGDALDLGPSLDTWTDIEAASHLLKLVRYMDKQDAYCGNFDALHSIWRITDNKDIGKPNVDGFLQNAGITLGKKLFDFPRLSNPDSTNPHTGFVIPPQLYLPQVTPSATLTQIGRIVKLTGSVTKLSVIDSLAQFGWSIETPDSSQAKLANPQNNDLVFTPDVRGVYFPALSVTTPRIGRSPITVLVPVAERVVAADALTETFESGGLRNSPFYWASSPELPWTVTDSTSYSGKFAVQGMLTSDVFSTELTVTFSLPDSDRISFAYWVPSDGGTLEFYINSHSVPTAAWGKQRGWNYVSFALSAGENTLTWFYWHLNRSTEVVWLDDIFFPRKASFEPTGVDKMASPMGYSLSQNYPNPFNNETAVHFSMSTPQWVTLTVYDVLGRKVRVLLNGRKSAGTYTAHFNTNGLAGGMYFYRLTAGPFRATKSMVVLK